MIGSIKKSLICKNMVSYKIDHSLIQTYIPKVGDVALFKVKEIGKHSRLQNYKGKNRLLFSGDLILCAFGHRYATNQIEGYVPSQTHEEYHILGQGGVVGIVKSMYKPLEEKGPTTLELIGYAVDNHGAVMNTKVKNVYLRNFADKNNNKAKVILSVGSSMDSGKTTTAGYLSRGIALAGKKVCYMKLTGTVYTKDSNFALDCGAHRTIDFGYFGFPSTFMCEEEELIQLFNALMYNLERDNPDYVIVEIADGLLQRETYALLQNQAFMKNVYDVIFSGGDSLGVLSGLNLLKQWNIHPFAVAGLITSHPLLMKEVSNKISSPILHLEELASPDILNYLDKHSPSIQTEFSNVA